MEFSPIYQYNCKSLAQSEQSGKNYIYSDTFKIEAFNDNNFKRSLRFYRD